MIFSQIQHLKELTKFVRCKGNQESCIIGDITYKNMG